MPGKHSAILLTTLPLTQGIRWVFPKICSRSLTSAADGAASPELQAPVSDRWGPGTGHDLKAALCTHPAEARVLGGTSQEGRLGPGSLSSISHPAQVLPRHILGGQQVLLVPGTRVGDPYCLAASWLCSTVAGRSVWE